MDVLAVGNINTDISFFFDRMPEPDCETEALEYSLFQGGSAANFAVAAARLGLKTGIVGCLGADAFGAGALLSLKEAEVDTSLVKMIDGERTGAVCVLVDGKGGRRMIAYRGANRNLADAVSSALSRLEPAHSSRKKSAQGKTSDAEEKAEADIIQLCNVKPEIIRTSKGMSRLLSLDPGGGARFLRTEDLKGVDILLLNESECRSITGLDYVKGAEALSQFAGTVVVKLGAKGAFLLGGGLRKLQPAVSVNVLDTTGAGDTFDAGFIAAISQGKNPEEALAWGSAAAALKIQARGARSGAPTKKELLEFLSSKFLS